MTAAKSAPGQGPKLTVVESAQLNSPGQRLMRSRSARNLAVEDVARQLNLSVSMVKAIESDNFKALPGRAFVKGYLRNYARLVSIDADELLRAYESQFSSAEEDALNPPELKRRPRWIAPLVKGIGYLVLVAIVLSIGSVIFQNMGFLVDKAQQLTASFRSDGATVAPEAETPAPIASDAGEGDTVKLSIPLHPVDGASGAPAAGEVSGETQTPATAESPIVAPTESGNQGSSDVVPPQSSIDLNVRAVVESDASPQTRAEQNGSAAVVPAAGLATEAVPVGSTVEKVGTAGADVASLSLVFSGMSWVRVRDATTRVLFDGTRSSGAEVQVQGRAPFDIRLGNAPVVKVILNGKPRDFDFSSRSNVAQFTLGDE